MGNMILIPYHASGRPTGREQRNREPGRVPSASARVPAGAEAQAELPSRGRGEGEAQVGHTCPTSNAGKRALARDAAGRVPWAAES
jgi:hypothetical protein